MMRRTLVSIGMIPAAILFVLVGCARQAPHTLYMPAVGDPMPGALYARAIQLRYAGSGNNRMYATFERYVNGTPTFPIYESKDSGKTWRKISDVTDQINGWGMRYQPFVYEMPVSVGNLAAGTVLCAGKS